MKLISNKTIHYFPRVLAILYICFLAIFAMDVFAEGQSWQDTIIALGMHLIPNFLLLILLIVSWNNEKIGALTFALVGIAFTVFFKSYTDIIAFLLIPFPVFLISAGFLFEHYTLEKEKLSEK